MAFSCKKCGTKVESKPLRCPQCNQNNKGWMLVADKPVAAAAAAGPVYDFEQASSTPITQITTTTSLDALAGQHGLPDADCLNALFAAITPPAGSTKDKDSIYFTVFSANYNSRDRSLTKTKHVTNQAFAKTGRGASTCAELFMWEEVKGQISDARPYVGIGQTIRPCDLCTARYAALAGAKAVTLMVYFERPYDARKGNSWLLFSPEGGMWEPA